MIILNPRQFERLSNIFDNAGQVFLGVVVLSQLFDKGEKINWFVVVIGLISMIICWVTSVSLISERKK